MLNLPGKLAIHYAWPSTVKDSINPNAKPAAIFSAYDIVVLGEGLENPTHADHANTLTIIQNLKTTPNHTQVYGYLPIGVGVSRPTDSEIKTRIDLWNAMGVVGIFLDEAGYDYGVTRERQNAAVEYAHGKGLRIFINANEPDDVFSSSMQTPGNPTRLPTLLGANDIYLYESFQVTYNKDTCKPEFQDATLWTTKSQKCLNYRNQFGTRMAAVTRVSGENPGFVPTSFSYAWWSALLLGFDYMGWGEADFSANTSELPFRPRPNPGYLGNDYNSDVLHPSPNLHRRMTPGGTIEVDTAKHTAGISTAAFWRFEEGTGNVPKDSSAYGNHGHISGATYSVTTQQYPNVTNRFGLLFDAKGDYVTIPAGTNTNLHSFPSGITIEAFIKPAQLPIPPDASGKRIKYILWADDDVFALRLESDASGNTLLVGVINAVKGATGPCTLSANGAFNRNLAGIYTHIALTYGSKLLKLYINGALVKQVPAPATCNDVVGPVGARNIVRIGSDETAEMQNYDRDFRGMIDEVRISGRALAPSEFLPRY